MVRQLMVLWVFAALVLISAGVEILTTITNDNKVVQSK